MQQFVAKRIGRTTLSLTPEQTTQAPPFKYSYIRL